MERIPGHVLENCEPPLPLMTHCRLIRFVVRNDHMSMNVEQLVIDYNYARGGELIISS